MTTLYFRQGERESVVIDKTVEILSGGGIIAYPTETVYGIGCDIRDENAASKIYGLKKRDSLNPLTANIYSLDQLKYLCEDIPDRFYKLADRFLPGPLSIILKKRPEISDYITSKLDTIAVRMPDNLIFRKILEQYEIPVAGTSANQSAEKPALKARETIEFFGGKIGAIIDGGKCRLGIESTVVNLAVDKPFIVREGAIDPREIEITLGINLS